MRCVHVLAAILAVCAAGTSSSFAGPLDSVPLRPGAQVPEYCTIGGQPVTTTIKPRGANGTAFHTPWPVEWILDIEVPPGRQVMITLITDQQYKALSAGRKPSGQPPLKDNLVNIDTASVRLPAGGYFWALNNTSNTPLTVSYRCSFIRK